MEAASRETLVVTSNSVFIRKPVDIPHCTLPLARKYSHTPPRIMLASCSDGQGYSHF
jgi:hypothetical protein